MTDRFRMIDLAPGRRAMTVRASDIERIEEHDPHPDLSWLELDANPANAEANAERRAAYDAGEWHCIGVYARATFPIDLGEAAMLHTRRQPRPVGHRERQRPGLPRRGVRGGRRGRCAASSPS